MNPPLLNALAKYGLGKLGVNPLAWWSSGGQIV